MDKELKKRKRANRFRGLEPIEPVNEVCINNGSQTLVNFSSNDYLGLSKHPQIIEKAREYTQKYGAGSTASRLVSGTYHIHQQLEEKVARTFGWEASLVFNSGFQANSTIISTLADRHALILADKLSHNSLLQGSIASRATFRRFEHNSLDDLEDRLEQAQDESYSRIIVIAETLYSMDGDRSDVEALGQLTDQYGAFLFIDDAHAVGVWGPQGLGLAYGVPGVDLVLGTCGKAFGSFGAFALCSKKMKQFLINFCPGFIYTTALPPPVIGSIEAALDVIPTLDTARKKLRKNIQLMKLGIEEAGYSTGLSQSQIIPAIIGDDRGTILLADHFKGNGFLAVAIRPPTVSKGEARIRVTLTAQHTEKQIANFLTVLNDWNYD
ncbi:8-amino-7-oxononanoate synthase [Aliifodinibius sp. 1BSP15-2V2]|uniref:8-amino-7-oxononanoate synthase n=1 Tax=Fodinibius salsisoli TaxID=2820877 RepID=A0ABT3PMN8_9BACT|nr:8-amino-7-oxononanoate synthase [Fodinibius salsisoli]